VFIKDDPNYIKGEDGIQLFTKNGKPTLETLRHNGKLQLIDVPAPDEVVTERPKKP
jgi:hypothetical protein